MNSGSLMIKSNPLKGTAFRPSVSAAKITRLYRLVKTPASKAFEGAQL
jgi:hypothetical protein